MAVDKAQSRRFRWQPNITEKWVSTHQMKQRRQWEAALFWYRLRYDDPTGATKAVNQLSQTKGIQRVALCYLADSVTKLYIGVVEVAKRPLFHMAEDYRFSLTAETPHLPQPLPKLVRATALPTQRTCIAHIVDACLFVSVSSAFNSDEPTYYFPTPSAKEGDHHTAVWQLPSPTIGITTIPTWHKWPFSKQLQATFNDPHKWTLGRDYKQKPLAVGGRINLYGRTPYAQAWLTRVISQALVAHPHRIVVLDGTGDLARALKRKPIVTKHIQKRLRFVDMDGLTAKGFNPLQPLPQETSHKTLTRWHRWFSGLGVRSDSLALLPEAFDKGVRDVYQLNRWLLQKRATTFAAVESFRTILAQIINAPELGNWLNQPARYFELFPGGSLIFAVAATNWERKQLLHAVLLTAVHLPQTRLIIHGYPWWDKFHTDILNTHRVIISNGPQLTHSHCVLVKCQPENVARLSARFLKGDPILTENYALLDSGDAILIHDEAPIFVTWNKPLQAATNLNREDEKR